MEYMKYTNRAVSDGLLEVVEQNGKNYVYYGLDKHRERYDDPEEKVRAEYWSELVCRYGYKPENIGFEVIIPDKTQKDIADIVIFMDAGKNSLCSD